MLGSAYVVVQEEHESDTGTPQLLQPPSEIIGDS
jgi:hypothetical protein